MTVAQRGRMEIGGGGGALLALLILSAVPLAAQTRAGIAITNVATARVDGATVSSNAVTLTVAERLDLTLARTPDADRGSATGDRSVAVTLVNSGNGDEAFVVAASVEAGSAIVAPILIAGSAQLAAGGTTPVLAPGASLVMLVPISAVARGTVLALTAHAATGSGAPGTVFAQAGDGGGDAVVGATGAAARLDVALAADLPPTFEKSQTVRAPDGSARATRGAAITYTLVARFAAAAAGVEIDDPVPAGTTYAPGSLSLDGAPLADAGRVAEGRVTVPLGAVPAGTVRTLRFTVIIS